MNIQFDKDINLFENKNDLDIIKKLPSYKKYYKPIFIQYIQELNFDIQYIELIRIIHNKSSYGTTKHNIKDGQIIFIIELSDDIIPYVSNVQNSTDTFKSKSIVQHEICHCIEIKQLYDSNCLGNENPLNENFKINTTYNFLYEQAVNIWSEFFACYNNRKINEWHECPNVEEDLDQLNKWILATQYHLNNHNDVRLCEDMLKFLHTFWCHMVSLVAVHLHNSEDILIDDYKNSKYNYIPPYFEYIYQYFKINIEYYPTWLSEDNYINLGKSLLKVLDINQITYSTNDLSDNFIFISTK